MADESNASALESALDAVAAWLERAGGAKRTAEELLPKLVGSLAAARPSAVDKARRCVLLLVEVLLSLHYAPCTAAS